MISLLISAAVYLVVIAYLSTSVGVVDANDENF